MSKRRALLCVITCCLLLAQPAAAQRATSPLCPETGSYWGIVRVLDAGDHPIVGATVTFLLGDPNRPDDDASLSGTNILTNADGVARLLSQPTTAPRGIRVAKVGYVPVSFQYHNCLIPPFTISMSMQPLAASGDPLTGTFLKDKPATPDMVSLLAVRKALAELPMQWSSARRLCVSRSALTPAILALPPEVEPQIIGDALLDRQAVLTAVEDSGILSLDQISNLPGDNDCVLIGHFHELLALELDADAKKRLGTSAPAAIEDFADDKETRRIAVDQTMLFVGSLDFPAPAVAVDQAMKYMDGLGLPPSMWKDVQAEVTKRLTGKP